MRRIATDPARAGLQLPPGGRDLTITSADGTSLHAEVFGPDSGQAIVLVHGWTENLRFWTYTIRDLSSRGYRVVALELRGHGDSAPAASNDYSLRRFGEDVDAALDATITGEQRAVLVGHSLGAMSIVAWAEHHDVAQRAGALALINTGVGALVAEHLVMPVPKFAKAINEAISVHGFLGAPGPIPRFSTPISYALTRYFAFGPAASPAQVALYEQMMSSCSWRVRADSGIAMSQMELHHVLPRLTVPTLVIAGARDRLTPPSHARRIAAELPHLHELVVLDETAHMAPLERPREVNDALDALAGVARDQAALAA
jgi:pimeloyl-ACP methyl ester carboxylesterase